MPAEKDQACKTITFWSVIDYFNFASVAKNEIKLSFRFYSIIVLEHWLCEISLMYSALNN